MTGSPHRSAALIGVRVVLATASVWVGFALAIDRWRSAEAAVAVAILRALGVDDAVRWGEQILVLGGTGRTFSADIGPWCSSLGVVLVLAVVAVLVVRGDRRRRVRAFVRGAAIVVACNSIRIVAAVLVGVHVGPGSIERFHDTIATAFAVGFVLAAFAAFVLTLVPRSAGGVVAQHAEHAMMRER